MKTSMACQGAVKSEWADVQAPTRYVPIGIATHVNWVCGAAILTIATLLLAGCASAPSASPAPTARAIVTSSSPTATMSIGPTATTSPVHVSAGPPARPCAAEHLAVRVVTGASVMSQPFDVVAFRNVGPSRCSLSGYPGLSAYTLRDGDELKVWASVRHGSIYERNDPGVHVVNVAPGREAWFAIGTATAYQGGLDLVSINRMIVYPPGSAIGIPTMLGFEASRPVGQAYPITVTAVYPPTVGASYVATTGTSPSTRPHRREVLAAVNTLDKYLRVWVTQGPVRASRYFVASERVTSDQGAPRISAGSIRSYRLYSWNSLTDFTLLVSMNLKFTTDPLAWNRGINTRFVTVRSTAQHNGYLLEFATGP